MADGECENTVEPDGAQKQGFRTSRLGAGHVDDFVRVRDRQWAKEERVHQAEDRRVGAEVSASVVRATAVNPRLLPNRRTANRRSCSTECISRPQPVLDAPCQLSAPGPLSIPQQVTGRGRAGAGACSRGHDIRETKSDSFFSPAGPVRL